MIENKIRDQESHLLFAACKFKKKCVEKFFQNTRERIKKHFWKSQQVTIVDQKSNKIDKSQEAKKKSRISFTRLSQK